MRKYKMILIAAAAGVIMTGCGQKASVETVAGKVESVSETASETVIETEAETAAETAANTDAEAVSGEAGLDNFTVGEEAAAEFGRKVKAAVAGKDLQALADLTSFPVYVGFKDDGKSVNTAEEFMKLGADRIFTEELLSSVAAADETGLTPSMAGFVLSDESSVPNIIYGVADGKLAVLGINY